MPGNLQRCICAYVISLIFYQQESVKTQLPDTMLFHQPPSCRTLHGCKFEQLISVTLVMKLTVPLQKLQMPSKIIMFGLPMGSNDS